MLKTSLFTVAILLSNLLFSQKENKPYTAIDTNIFSDAANHWNGIYDKSKVIQPKPNQPRYKSTELVAIADNILLYQKDNGGWPKNYDMQAILTPDQKDSLIKDKHHLNTTFDNRTTYSQIACLANIYSVTKDERYKVAALKGFDYILLNMQL